jgi:3-phosphoshikimate 1-carboxyvinyltransferase
MPDVSMQPISRPFVADLAPPGSKSLTNRALVLAALGDGKSRISNMLIADDTQVMLEGLRRLGFELEIDEASLAVVVHGKGGKIPAYGAELFCGNSGTTIRFLAALCSLGRGEFVLDGVARMRQRPIGELADLLRHLGVRTRYLDAPGFPPILVHADGLPGGMIQYGAAQSSQFLSAVLMTSPLARHEVQVDLIDKQTSWPYVAMTMRLMDVFGVTPELIRDPLTGEPKRIIIPQWHYAATEYSVEPDASNATYFLALAAIHPGSRVTIRGLGKHSLQGDVRFADVLKRMGAEADVQNDSITITGREGIHGIVTDLSEMPDTAQTLAVAALFAEGQTTIHGLRTLRVKETDRLAALSNELSRLGATVEIEEDTLHIDPPEKIRPAEIQTYDDHRMAMSFALAGTKAESVVIKDAQCVSKTYPNFFEDLRRVVGLCLMLVAMLAGLVRADDAATQPSGVGTLPNLQLDVKARQIRVSCEALNVKMPLEFFCVQRGGPEHETVLRTAARPSDIHFALLALGLAPGEPAHLNPSDGKWYPPDGPPLKISCEFMFDGKMITVPANRMMRSVKTHEEAPTMMWVFDGSRVLPDGQYAADIAGYVVSVVNFDMTMIDVPDLASNDNDTLQWEYNPDLVPARLTPVTMIIEPSDEKPTSRPSGTPASDFNPGPGLEGGAGAVK